MSQGEEYESGKREAEISIDSQGCWGRENNGIPEQKQL